MSSGRWAKDATSPSGSVDFTNLLAYLFQDCLYSWEFPFRDCSDFKTTASMQAPTPSLVFCKYCS